MAKERMIELVLESICVRKAAAKAALEAQSYGAYCGAQQQTDSFS